MVAKKPEKTDQKPARKVKGKLSQPGKKRPRLTEKTKREAAERVEKVRPVEVTLQFQHSINGINYGPGRIRVPGNVANALRGQESAALEEVNRFRGERAMVILGGRQTKRVSLDYFNNMEFVDPYATLRGR